MRISDWSSDVCSADLQQAVQDRFGLLSPLVPLRSLSMATSGTGLVDQERFNQTVQDFRIGMIRQMNNELIENTTMKDPLYIAGEEVFGKEIGRASCRERVCQYV